MSEIVPSEKEHSESSGTIVESSECNADVVAVQNKAEEETTLKLETEEEETTLESASVDVTSESNDSDSISSSTTEYESCKSQVSEETSEEINDGSIDEDSDEDSDEEDEDLNEEGTVTCALLGLEQAKVSFKCLALDIFQFSDLFYHHVSIAIVKTLQNNTSEKHKQR